MSQHRVTLNWSRTTPDFQYKTYNRDHTLTFKNGQTVRASAAPAYRGNELVDPEDMLVASLSSCHMLTFLAVACQRGFAVEHYEDDAVGFLEKNAEGRLAITRVILKPRITFTGDAPDAATLEQLHDKAHKECFIANSVKSQVNVEWAGQSIRPTVSQAAD
jgi:organic hydroperoxide reductase OsmC/OhrA